MNLRAPRRAIFGATLAALTLAACGGEGRAPTTPTPPISPPPPPPPSPSPSPSPIATVVAADSAGLRGTVGAPLAELMLQVRRRDGTPARDVAVAWEVSAGTVQGSSTDTNGVARATWTLGTRAGPQTLVARVDTFTVRLTATAVAGPPVRATVDGGDGQAGEVGTTLPAPVAVRLTDAYDNVVPAALVRWTASDGASTAATTTQTDSSGIARTTWTLGPRPGPTRLTVTADGAAAASVTMTATARVGAPAELEATEGDAQDGPFGSWLPRPLTVRVLDRYGNPVPDAVVTFTPDQGGVTLSRAASTTDSAGVAAAALRMPLAYGPVTVTVRATGVATTRRFRATSRAATFASVSMHGSRTCALTTEGVAYCWGDNIGAGLGLGPSGTARYITTPTPVETRQRFRAIDVGYVATCAISTEDALWCWGSYNFGIGMLDRATHGEPVLVPSPRPVASVASAGEHVCAVLRDGSVGCFGENSGASGGPPSAWASAAAVMPLTTPVRFSQLTGAFGFTCGVGTDAVGYCWGTQVLGRLGIAPPPAARCTLTSGELPCTGVPTPVTSTARFRTISAGAWFTCALSLDAAAYCWGENLVGQIGDGTRADRATPTRVRLDVPLRQVQASTRTACALSVAGEMYCWGQGVEVIGASFPSCSPPSDPEAYTTCGTLPVKVPTGALRFTSISVDGATVCGTATDRALYCWGENSAGNVGDGTGVDRTQPTRVARQP